MRMGRVNALLRFTGNSVRLRILVASHPLVPTLRVGSNRSRIESELQYINLTASAVPRI